MAVVDGAGVGASSERWLRRREEDGAWSTVTCALTKTVCHRCIGPVAASTSICDGQLLCADGHAITIAASSTLVPAAGRCTMDEGVERVVTATTASVYMHGFAIGRCGAGGECLGSLGDAREVFTEVGNMYVRETCALGKTI